MPRAHWLSGVSTSLSKVYKTQSTFSSKSLSVQHHHHRSVFVASRVPHSKPRTKQRGSSVEKKSTTRHWQQNSKSSITSPNVASFFSNNNLWAANSTSSRTITTISTIDSSRFLPSSFPCVANTICTPRSESVTPRTTTFATS